MAFSVSTVTTWVKENPIKAAGIGLASAAVIALAVSPKARKLVGLAGVNSRHKTSKKVHSHRAKTLRLK